MLLALLTWLSFLNLAFWLSFSSFILVSSNLFILLLLSEFIWVILYSFSAVVGTTVDEVGCFGLTFFILGLASIELCLGLLLLLILRRLKVSLNTNRNTKNKISKLSQTLAIGLLNKPIV